MSNHETATNERAETKQQHRPYLPHLIRILAIPIILGWVIVTVIVNVAVPTLEVVGEAHSAPMAPLDAPSMKAMMRMGQNFHEFNSNSTVMVVVEGQQAARRGSPPLLRRHRAQTAQRHQARSAHPRLLGRQVHRCRRAERRRQGLLRAGQHRREPGHHTANNSVEAVRKVVDEEKAPPGVKAYVTGPAALSDDMHVIGNDSLAKITLFTLGAIAIMLLLVYRSIVTTLIQLFMTFVALRVREESSPCWRTTMPSGSPRSRPTS